MLFLYLFHFEKGHDMHYLITKLLTEGSAVSFHVLGLTEDKKRAASIAADAYKEYNKAASFQNIEMITEWLATRREYSFRRDREHRLQLAITEIEGETLPPEHQLVYSAEAEEDALMQKVSQALMENGQHTAGRLPGSAAPPAHCPAFPSHEKNS